MANKKNLMVDGGSLLTGIPRDGRKCIAGHFGSWAIEPKWFAAAIKSIKDGTLKPQSDYGDDEEGDDQKGYTLVDGIAVIRIDGQMTKRGSSFGGCSTVAVRKALREAAMDYMVRGILMQICTPGGSCAGTSDLADDILGIRNGTLATHSGKGIRVDAFAEDVCCSAGYWVAASCQTITANRTAMVGCIGTYVVLSDDTGAQEQVGIKYQVVSSGKYKGLGADGAITPDLISDVQREIDELNTPFLEAVKDGRGSKIDIVQVSDGRTYVAAQALELGLIDSIASLDAAIETLSIRSPYMNLEQFKAFAAEHPEAVAAYIEQGKKAGAVEAHAAELTRFKAVREACKGDDTLACNTYEAGKDAEDAKFALDAVNRSKAQTTATSAEATAKIEAQAKEIERLKAEAGTQGAIGTSAAAKEAAKGPTAAPERPDTNDRTAVAEWAKAAAKHEWDTNPETHKGFSSEANYVSSRAAELRGDLKILKK